MKKYNFLLKPLFFIFSLLFATWLVLKIEKISPSDFNEYETSGQKPTIPQPQQYIKKLCMDYKKGIIDSTQLDQRLTFFFKSSKNLPGDDIPATGFK